MKITNFDGLLKGIVTYYNVLAHQVRCALVKFQKKTNQNSSEC